MTSNPALIDAESSVYPVAEVVGLPMPAPDPTPTNRA